MTRNRPNAIKAKSTSFFAPRYFSFPSMRGFVAKQTNRIGIKKKDTEMLKLHTPDFDIDEAGLQTGVANLSWLIYSFLED